MASRDYYEILGVQRAADPATIKSAYRKLAMQYHPDQNPGDKAAEDQFEDINEAYAVLSDPEKRAQFDRFGKAAFEGAQGGGGYQDFSDIFNEVFGDAFGDLFGGRQGGGGQARHPDQRNRHQPQPGPGAAARGRPLVRTDDLCKDPGREASHGERAGLDDSATGAVAG